MLPGGQFVLKTKLFFFSTVENQNPATLNYDPRSQQSSSYHPSLQVFSPQGQNISSDTTQNQVISNFQPGSYHPNFHQSQQQHQPRADQTPSFGNFYPTQYYHY